VAGRWFPVDGKDWMRWVERRLTSLERHRHLPWNPDGLPAEEPAAVRFVSLEDRVAELERRLAEKKE
jgi:hypothetical protein